MTGATMAAAVSVATAPGSTLSRMNRSPDHQTLGGSRGMLGLLCWNQNWLLAGRVLGYFLWFILLKFLSFSSF